MDADAARPDGTNMLPLLARLLKESLLLWAQEASISATGNQIEIASTLTTVTVRFDPANGVAHWWVAVRHSNSVRLRPAVSVLGVLSVVRRHLEDPRNA
jgi:hypothetical protein